MNNIDILEEKEKKAIEILHNWLCDEHSKFCRVGAVGIPNEEFFATEIVLNLVKNLIAENKELKEKNKELEKMLNLKSHKRRYNTMNYIKKNKLNKFDTVGICQDMRAFKRTGEIKYRAYITFQNKQHTLGVYNSLDKAKEARRKGEIMVENIKKNFVEKIKWED